MVEIRRITDLNAARPEIDKLGIEHWQECETALSQEPPKVMWEMYQILQQQGTLIAYGAYSGDQLVGYSAVIISPNPHYGWSALFAMHDVTFIAREHRKGTTAMRLTRAIEAAAKKRGAKWILWTAKPYTAFDTMMRRHATHEENTYRRTL